MPKIVQVTIDTAVYEKDEVCASGITYILTVAWGQKNKIKGQCEEEHSFEWSGDSYMQG